MGMTESGRRGESVHLRGWDDYERYSLQLTGSRTSGLGHAAFRTRSPQALERRVAAIWSELLGIRAEFQRQLLRLQGRPMILARKIRYYADPEFKGLLTPQPD